MLVHRPLETAEEKQEVELLLARCNLRGGLDLPVAVPAPGELPDGGMAPFLWLVEGCIAGFLAPEGWPIPEGTPLVHPLFRRRGIGRALVQAATSECRARGLKRWLMAADSESEGSAAFAEAVGARCDSSEYRMELDRTAVPACPPPPDGLSLDPVEDDPDEFARTLAIAFDDPLDQVRVWAAEQWEHPGVRLFVAHAAGEPIGTLRLITVGFQVFLTAVGVTSSHRRKGIGRWIVLKTVHELLDEGWEHVLIEVDTQNTPALELYRACGFRETRTYQFFELLTGNAKGLA